MQSLSLLPREVAWSGPAEISVIGGILAAETPDSALLVLDLLEDADFFREQNRILFRRMSSLVRSGVPVDVVTLSESLQASGEYQAAGGAQYLSQIINNVPTAANIEHHARIIREKAHLRRLANLSAEIVALTETGKPPTEIQAEAERLIFAAGQQARSDTPLIPIRDVLWQTFEKMESAEPDVLTGFADLDYMAGGMPRGDLVILAARPSMGKTAMCLQIAVNVAARKEAEPVAVFSLEMTAEAMTRRMLFTEALVDSVRFRQRPREEDYARLSKAAAFLQPLPIFIQDRVRTVGDIRTQCRRLALSQQKRLGCIVVDYLGKLAGAKERDSRVHELGDITGDLKRLAVELDTPVLLLSQLSRAVEQRNDKRPIMSDLRDSGEIEQDADSVMFLYRPEYYLGPTDKDGNSLQGKAELIVGKQRNGATGTVHLRFAPEHTRFFDAPARLG